MKALKFKNQPTAVDGIAFDSKREAKRYGELKLLERAGHIVGLKVHPKFDLTVNGTKLGTYSADFQYRRADGSEVTEDVKGGPTDTPIFRWKARHLLAEHGIKVEIVR